MSEIKVVFNAEIKQITHKQLVSGDCATRIVLDKDAMDTDKVSVLNALQSLPTNRSQELKITIEAI